MATTSFKQDFVIESDEIAAEIADNLEKSEQQVSETADCYTAPVNKEELIEKEQRALAVFQKLLQQSH